MTLTIQDLGALGELLGSVAVLVTLVYLALQTRQNTAAIGAQLDAAQISSVLGLNLIPATSTELMEALAEDRTDDRTTNEMRRNEYWVARFYWFQWNFSQAQRGLLASTMEARLALRVRDFFNTYRSAETWWDGTKHARLSPEFVEWGEEQRAKATDAVG